MKARITPENCNLPAPPDLDAFNLVMDQMDNVAQDLMLKMLDSTFMKMRAIHVATQNSVRQSPKLIEWQRQQLEYLSAKIIDFGNNNQHE